MNQKNVFYKYIIVSILLFSSKITTAEYNPGKLGEAAGQYLSVTMFMNKLKTHECGYLLNKKYDFQAALKDVNSVLKKRDRKELALELKSGNMGKIVRDMYHDFLVQYNKLKAKKHMNNKKNPEFLCAMFTGQFIFNVYYPSEEKWGNYKKIYSK